MWFIVALALGAGLVALGWWFNSKGIKTTWYEWVIGVAGLLLVLFTLQNYFGSVAEVENEAANLFLLVLGLPALILLAISWQLVVRTNNK